jgi:TPR repeat protein
MGSFWKIAVSGASAVVICGTAILWWGHNEKANELRLDEAARVCRLSAEKGDAKAQYSLGHMYYYGQGVLQDYTEAVRWYREAADQGDAKGQYGLGYMYYHGQGVPQDYAEAARWYEKSADQGDANAQVNLALTFYRGQGVPQDYTEAVGWYRKAADQGDAAAEDGLGLMYYQGKGVPQDYTEAARWYRRAADQGFASAQYSLGFMYYHGQGVPENRTEANRWFRKAADQGDENAERTLAVGLTMPRELFLTAEFLGGMLLVGGSLLLGKWRWSLRSAVAPLTGALCIFTALLSWYGYTHYILWCVSCGFNEFTWFKWLLNAVLIGLLIYIARTKKKADWRIWP